MFDSKAIKDFPDRKRSKLYLWWIETPVCDWYHDIKHKLFIRPYELIAKTLGWYWNVFRTDFDFDFHSIFSIIEYKLKRVEKALLNGCAIHEPKDMKALSVVIKLAGRLKNESYDMESYDRLEKKWGKMISWFTPCEGRPDLSTWHTKHEKENTPEDKVQCWEDRKTLWASAEKKRVRDERNFYAILQKYGRSWWD